MSQNMDQQNLAQLITHGLNTPPCTINPFVCRVFHLFSKEVISLSTLFILFFPMRKKQIVHHPRLNSLFVLPFF